MDIGGRRGRSDFNELKYRTVGRAITSGAGSHVGPALRTLGTVDCGTRAGVPSSIFPRGTIPEIVVLAHAASPLGNRALLVICGPSCPAIPTQSMRSNRCAQITGSNASGSKFSSAMNASAR